MAQVCPNCGRSNSDSRLTCKDCSTPLKAPREKRAGSGGIVGVPLIGIVVAGLLGLVVIAAMTGNSGALPSSNREPTHSDAYRVCKDAISEQLVAPVTARFNDGSGRIVENERGGFLILGEVDSENRFGAMIRADFTCTIGHDLSVEQAVIVER